MINTPHKTEKSTTGEIVGLAVGILFFIFIALFAYVPSVNWLFVDKSNIESLTSFVQRFPDSNAADMAKEVKKPLLRQRINEKFDGSLRMLLLAIVDNDLLLYLDDQTNYKWLQNENIFSGFSGQLRAALQKRFNDYSIQVLSIKDLQTNFEQPLVSLIYNFDGNGPRYEVYTDYGREKSHEFTARRFEGVLTISLPISDKAILTKEITQNPPSQFGGGYLAAYDQLMKSAINYVMCHFGSADYYSCAASGYFDDK